MRFSQLIARRAASTGYSPEPGGYFNVYRGDYCPFDPVRDANRLGLTHRNFEDDLFGRVHVAVRSDPSSPPEQATVLLHGIGGSWTAWSAVLQQAAYDDMSLGNLLIFDLPGFGASENRTRALDGERVADMVVNIARRCGFTRCRVVGQSMGGYLALTLAATKPQFCSSVVSLSGTLMGMSELMTGTKGRYIPRPGTALGRCAYLILRAAGRGVVRPLARVAAVTGLLRRTLKHTAAHPEKLTTQMLGSLANGIRPEAYILAADNARQRDAIKLWSAITCPVTLLFGSADAVAGVREAEMVGLALPDLRLEMVADCGHLIPVERPADVVRAVRNP